ncbi:MAG: PAS domain-containing protein [Chloroflexi bacterium]|nr:PAS domain-containing protein [Chloroflexota bacterium]
MIDPDGHPDLAGGWQTLDEAGFPACLIDSSLQYRRANAAWLAYLQGDTFRFGPQEVTIDGRSLLADVPADRRDRWSRALSEIVAGRLGHFVDRLIEHRALGDRLVMMTASPTVGPSGAVNGALCVRYDMTGPLQAAANEERLSQVLLAARRLQHFMGNQLALTLGYVELLTFDPRLPPELRDRVDEALRGVIEATETLSKLRLVTRLEMDPDDPDVTDGGGHP